MNLPRLILVALATARATRFFTADKLGEWAIVGPLKRWAWRRESTADPAVLAQLEEVFERDLREGKPQESPAAHYGWRSKLVGGLDCGYCLSPWIFGGLLIGSAIASRVPGLRHVFSWLLTTLAGSYVVGHTWNRLDNG